MSTLPPGVDDSRLQTLLRGGDTKYQFLVSLKIGTSLTRARKDLILRKAVARDLDARYVEMLPLSIDAAADILSLLRARFPRGRVPSLPEEAIDAFYKSLRNAPGPTSSIRRVWPPLSLKSRVVPPPSRRRIQTSSSCSLEQLLLATLIILSNCHRSCIRARSSSWEQARPN